MAAQDSYIIRRGKFDDIEFLWDMLYEASNWRSVGARPTREEALSVPEISLYLKGWGRPGDASVVAVEPQTGHRVGAAWYRLFTTEKPAFGFVAADIPELGIGVVPEWRGRGVGGALLEVLFSEARSHGFDSLSLSVERDNTRAVRLYEHQGFVKLFASEQPDSWTMKVDL